VKWPINRLAVFLSRFRALRPSETQSEASAPIGVALFACLVCFGSIYWVTRSVVGLLAVWWAELLVYALIPVSVTFVILYRSDWHRGITGTKRTSLMLLLSSGIFCCAIFAIGMMLLLGCIFTLGLKADMSPQ
jgi:hypothetical protein